MEFPEGSNHSRSQTQFGTLSVGLHTLSSTQQQHANLGYWRKYARCLLSAYIDLHYTHSITQLRVTTNAADHERPSGRLHESACSMLLIASVTLSS